MFCIVCGNTSDDGDGWTETESGALCYNCADNAEEEEDCEKFAKEALGDRCKECGCEHKK